MKNKIYYSRLYHCTGIAVSCLMMFAIITCKSHSKEEPSPEPVQNAAPKLLPEVKEPPEPSQPQPKPQEPFITDWENTTWINRDSDNNTAKTWPGYRGFHLASDGNLILINMDAAIGNKWQGNDNTLTLKLLNGRPDFPLEGIFHTFKIDNPDNSIDTMRLVPDTRPDSDGIIFEKATIAIDIIENHWNPRNLNNSEGIRWPAGKDIHLLFLPNGRGGINAIGYGGVNRFNGHSSIGAGKISLNPIPITGRKGEDSEFENLFLQTLKETTHYVQVDKDMFFFKNTVPLVAFNAQLFN